MANESSATIEVRIWNKRVGAVSADPKARAFAFEYAPAWTRRGIELAPLTMPAQGANRPFVFPSLSNETYKGLPGLLADSLPDKFGTNLINAWMAHRGVPAPSTTALDYLAYMGKRGMGALEFRPAIGASVETKKTLDVSGLVDAARNILHGDLKDDAHAKAALTNIIRVGTSAGGARAKAVVAWNPNTGELRSGQFDVADGFEHWLLKFDGMGTDAELGESQAYGRIEYAYSLMARAAGIDMAPCRLLHENGRHHFMTKRWDRDGNTRHHVQSLCGLAHLDFNQRGTHAYEQLFQAMDQLNLGAESKQQVFRRMALSVMAANCDDHTKNHAFILKEGKDWAIAPAYDLTHAYNPMGEWTSEHLMSVNGRFADIRRSDLMAVADTAGVPDAASLLANVRSALDGWSEHASLAGLDAVERDRVAKDFRPV